MSVWRLIKDVPLDGALNMAVDEALLCAVDGAASQPVLRLYDWSEPTISIGRLQDPAKYLDSGLPVVRRITGGRAVLHSREITYSIVVPAGHEIFDQGILGAYYRISSCIVAAFKLFGVEAQMTRSSITAQGSMEKSACFIAPSRHEVTINGRKIVGSAQRRLRGAFLQHGSILTGFDEHLSARIFGHELSGRVTWLGAHTHVSADAFRDKLVFAFADGLDAQFRPDVLSGAEEAIKNSILEGFAGPSLTRRALMQIK